MISKKDRISAFSIISFDLAIFLKFEGLIFFFEIFSDNFLLGVLSKWN
jgi:hypothetical protein